MSDYLYKKFYGTYRILVPIDSNTNDFCRTHDGKIDSEDYYIPCKKSGREIAQISHYHRNILDVLIFTINTGRKMVKLCEQEKIPISDIKEGDGELSFKFKAENIDFIAEKLGAITQGKNIRPFSIKNLPKSDYKIPPEDLDQYKAVTASVPQGDKLIISRLTDEFLDKKFEKSLRREGKTVEQELRFWKMSRMKKEYIHMKELWGDYIEFLKEELA